MASALDDECMSTPRSVEPDRSGQTDAAKAANMVSNAMCYRNAKTSSSSRSRSPRGLLLLDFDDIDSTNVFGYKDDRIQNDLLDEICSDIGIKDAIDLDFLDFDGATAACGAEYAAATNDGIFLADDLGDLDQTIPFGQLQREEGSGDTRHGHLTNAGQPRSAGCPEFLQQPRSCSADTYVMSPMSHSSCHSNQPGSSSSRNNLLDSSLESIGADYLGSCGDAAPSGVRMTCYDPPSVGSQHGSISSVPSSPRTDYKDSKRGRTMAADMKCSSPCRRDRFGNGSMVTAGGNQSGFANGSSHMQYTNIQNLVRSGASMVHSPGGASRSQFGELTSGSQSRPPSVSTSQKRSGFQCKLESTFDPGYYSVGSPSVCSGSSIMTAKVAEEAVTRDKVARYLDDCTMQQNYPLTDSEKQLSAAVPCGGAGGGMMSSPIKLVHSQPESPQSVGHVAKRARVISSGNELLEEVRECYSYVKGANMFAQARTPAMPGTHPAAPQNNSGARLMNGSVPPVSIMNGQVNPNPMNVSPATMQSNCRQQQLMQQQQQMMQQQQQQQMARFATPRNPRVLGTPQGYPQHQPQYGHSNMPAPMRTNNSFVTSNSFVPQGGIAPRMASYPVNSSASCNFTPVPPSDRTTCSYGTQPSASGYGTSYQNGCLEKENYHGAAPCQQIPNANFGGRTSNECQFFGYQTPAGPNALRYANSVDQFHSTSAMMSPGQPSRNQCGRAGGTGASFSGMHAASSMPNLAGNVPGFHSHPSGGSNPALNSIMNEFRPPQQQHSPKLPTHHQMAPPHQASGASTTSVQGQQGLIQRIISDQTNAFRSHSLFPLLRDLIIADMNFHSPTFPFQLIANLPTDFDKLLQNYLHRNPAAGDGRHGNQAVGKVIEDALRFAHKALIEKIRVRKEEVGYKDHVKPLSAIEAFCERFDKAVKNSSAAPNGAVLPNGISTSCHFQQKPSDQLSQKALLRPPMANRPQNVQLGGVSSSPRKSRPGTPHEHHVSAAETLSEFSYGSGSKCSGSSGESTGTGKNKVLPKESVAVMLAWLRQHQDNPYPNDDEKEMLIGQTKLTINQINYWFTNARRRILPKWALQRYMEQQDKQCHLGTASHILGGPGAPATNGVR